MGKILLLFALFVSGQLHAAEIGGKEGPDAIDEISVIGQRSLLSLHIEVFKLEESFYALFNELNSENEYDVTCHKEFRFMSHIKAGLAWPHLRERQQRARPGGF